MLAGLAPSNQTVAFIIEDPGATKGGSCRLSMKMSVDQLTPSTVNQSGKGELAVDQSGIDQLTLHPKKGMKIVPIFHHTQIIFHVC